MAYKINVDKNKCIGCGSCAAVCPEAFEMKDGKSVPKRAKVEKISCEAEAESICPVQAISISKA